MAGDLKIHPLTKMYDETRRGKLRLQKFLHLSGRQMKEADYKLYREIISLTEEIIEKIPDEYRLKPYEIQKEHEKMRGE